MITVDASMVAPCHLLTLPHPHLGQGRPPRKIIDAPATIEALKTLINSLLRYKG